MISLFSLLSLSDSVEVNIVYDPIKSHARPVITSSSSQVEAPLQGRSKFLMNRWDSLSRIECSGPPLQPPIRSTEGRMKNKCPVLLPPTGTKLRNAFSKTKSASCIDTRKCLDENMDSERTGPTNVVPTSRNQRYPKFPQYNRVKSSHTLVCNDTCVDQQKEKERVRHHFDMSSAKSTYKRLSLPKGNSSRNEPIKRSSKSGDHVSVTRSEEFDTLSTSFDRWLQEQVHSNNKPIHVTTASPLKKCESNSVVIFGGRKFRSPGSLDSASDHIPKKPNRRRGIVLVGRPSPLIPTSSPTSVRSPPEQQSNPLKVLSPEPMSLTSILPELGPQRQASKGFSLLKQDSVSLLRRKR